MARTIQSPGVEINEIDLSLRPVLPVGTTVLVPGFAKQGPISEVLQVNSLSEFEQVYGLPSTAAERYFYHTAKAVFQSNATMLATRLPYGKGSGQGTSDDFSALVYPAVSYSEVSADLEFKIGTSVASLKVLSGGSNFITESAVTADVQGDGTGFTLDGTKAGDIEAGALLELFVSTGGQDWSFVTENAELTAAHSQTGLVFVTETGNATVSGANRGIAQVVFSTVLSARNTGTGAVSAHEMVTGDTVTLSAVTVGDNSAADGVFHVRKISSDTFSVHSNRNDALAGRNALNLPHTGRPNSSQKFKVTHKTATLGALSAGADGGGYLLGAPSFVKLTEDQYNAVVENLTVDSTGVSGWDGNGQYDVTDTATHGFAYGGDSDNFIPDTATVSDTISSFRRAGMIVLNKGQTTNNSNYEGNYIGLIDNSNLNPATNFDGVNGVKGISSGNQLTTLPAGRLNFTLSGDSGSAGTISETMEKLPDFDISTTGFSDTLVLGMFKLRNSVFTQDVAKLDFILKEAFIGSLDKTRKIQDSGGGTANNFFMGMVEDDSSNVQVLVNKHIAVDDVDGTWLGVDGTPQRKVRVITNRLIDDTQDIFRKATGLKSVVADNLYGFGPYQSPNPADKMIGSIPTKLNKVFQTLDNIETVPIDLALESGLGTVFASSWAQAVSKGYTTSVANWNTFDDTYVLDLGESTDAANTGFYKLSDGLVDQPQMDIRDNYNAVLNEFKVFAENTRKDHMFIADPLRHFFVQGENKKVLSDKKFTFSKNVYWPLRHLYTIHNTSYGSVYSNWGKVFDPGLDKQVWVPMSGFIAATYANTDSNFQPWYAPAGFTRGRLNGINDLAVAPKQKNRDQLYNIAVNPIALFPNEGMVVFGQKTMYKLPSAFDRINVRRLFLWLERAVRSTIKFYLFEPNTELTRTLIKNNLQPIFEIAKNTQGVYDYMIVCDERNNTSERIDQNELWVDIYIKPVRAAEFILVNFYATKTGQDFSEIVS